MPFAGRAPEKIVAAAIGALARLGRVTAASAFYRSPAWPDPEDPPFVNAVAVIICGLPPAALLSGLQGVEAGFGRRRSRKNEPRTLDLDLLDYDGAVEGGEGGAGPVLPHPGTATRDFVLLPILDVAPGWRHPATGMSAVELLSRLGPPTARRI